MIIYVLDFGLLYVTGTLSHFLLTPYPSNFFDLITRLVIKRYIQPEGKGNLKSFDK